MENFDWIASAKEIVKIWVVTRGPGILGALLILALGVLVAGLVRRFLRNGLTRAGIDVTLVSFLGRLLYIMVLLLVAVVALSTAGVETTSVAAVLAAIGLAVALALQGSLSNFAAGVMIIVLRPFRVGDYVDVGGASGTVEDVSVFFTHLATPDNRQVILPNSQITSDAMTNYSAKAQRRVDLVVGIGYDDDLAEARRVLERVIAEEERLQQEPPPLVAVSELGDSSVNMVVRVWTDTADYWPVRFALIEKIKLALDDAGLHIPYPQRDLHLHQVA